MLAQRSDVKKTASMWVLPLLKCALSNSVPLHQPNTMVSPQSTSCFNRSIQCADPSPL